MPNLPRARDRIRTRTKAIVRNLTDSAKSYTYLLRRAQQDAVHLHETAAWLARAHDACNGTGVSISYDSKEGWHSDPYPETSGYILETFLRYADFSGKVDFANRAISIGNWEIDIQRSDGAVLSSVRRDVVRVFNTGQVILGWCCLFERTQDQRFLDAAIRGGNYLLAAQESDGSWVRDTYCGPRTYHARVAWSLMRLAHLSKCAKFLEAANKSIHWILAQQKASGWFEDCGFHSDPPITHTIGYTIQGLLECLHLAARNAWHVESSAMLDAVVPACREVVACIRNYRVANISGLLPAAFDARWKPAAHYSCLTGNAQLAVCLIRLGQVLNDDSYLEPASVLVEALKRVQDLTSSDPGRRGGVTGSFPSTGGYLPGKFPNWAAKFMADALMMKMGYRLGWWVQA